MAEKNVTEKNQKVEVNSKAKMFKQYLEEHKITAFTSENLDDELKSTVFRSHMVVAGQNLETIVLLDASIYGMLRVNVGGKLVNEANKEAILNYLNELNGKFKVFKYYVTDEGTIILDSCILLDSSAPNGEMIYTVINVVLKHLEEYYPQLMEKIWSKNKELN